MSILHNFLAAIFFPQLNSNKNDQKWDLQQARPSPVTESSVVLGFPLVHVSMCVRFSNTVTQNISTDKKPAFKHF